jgi:hypothetical protein
MAIIKNFGEVLLAVMAYKIWTIGNMLKSNNKTTNPSLGIGIDQVLNEHKGFIPENHPHRSIMVAHINKLMNSGPNGISEARRLYSRHMDKEAESPVSQLGGGDIKSILSSHSGAIPEDHPHRQIVAAHVNKLMSMGPKEQSTAKMLYNKHLKKSKTKHTSSHEQLESVLKSKDNHPKGGLTVSAARKLGIHAGIETHNEVKKKGGVSKLSDKTKSRRRSFCARHCGMKRKFPDAYKKKDSKGNKALRVWHCGSCSGWLKKSIGPDDQISFYKDGNVLDIYIGSDVPFEIESIVVDSILAKNYVEVDKELNKSRCWTGYKPVPGKKPQEKGSCEPIKKEEDSGREDQSKNYGKVKIRGSDKYHTLIGIHDTGIPAHEPGGGNVYLVLDPKTGKKSKIHQSQIEDIDLSKSKKEEYCEDKNKLIGEHKRLISKLKSKSIKDRKKEAKIQSKELKEMTKSDEEKIKQIKDKYRKPKEPSNEEKIKQIKDKYRKPKEPSNEEKIKQIKDKYRKPKEPSNEEKIKQIKDKYRKPKEPSNEEKIKQIKDKYKQKQNKNINEFMGINKSAQPSNTIVVPIGTFKQPTDEELFGHLVVNESIEKAAKQKWENAITGWHSNAVKNINSKFSSEEEELAYWRSIPVSNAEEDFKF